LIAQKLRTKDKEFSITGSASKMGLFGSQLARRGGKMIVLCEGEIDAMSISQSLGNTWPVLSLPNGSQNLAPVKDALEFLESYDKVVLCFDNDEPGHTATEAVLSLLSPGKAYVTDLGEHKDANELLRQDPQTLRNAIWDAREYRPDGVVNLSEIKERVSAPITMGIPYPWEGLNKYLFGYRPQELITWTAGTGVGKTAVVSELVYDMVVNQGKKVGLIYLEEGVVRTGRRLMGIHLNRPIHLPEHEVTPEEFDNAWEATLGTGLVTAWDHFGSVDVDLLANRVRWMRNGFDVDVVVLDHISLVVSGADIDADERRLLDRSMTLLRSLTQETGLTIHNVSHLKRGTGKAHEEGGTVSLQHLRGTQAIGQLSDAVIGLERNQQADNLEDKHLTTVRVLKNRYAGMTGVAAQLRFDPLTHRLHPVGSEAEQNFNSQFGDF
jgi:twinkle protein